jgi:fumarate hydratase subunit alpha
MEQEKSPLGRQILGRLLENHRLAGSEQVPACQDTGLAIVIVEMGQDVHITNGGFEAAVNEGVRRGYEKGYLRKSAVFDPVIDRKNTGDNTPAIIHTNIVPGDRLKITVAPKGGGAENMSATLMLKPADGAEGIKKFVLETVEKAGPNACPPLVVGIGIGGSFDLVNLLAKKALLRPMGSHHEDPRYAAMEDELLATINNLGIGPEGFGGTTTALAVHIETYACHIASLPVAVNLNCHVSPHESVEI